MDRRKFTAAAAGLVGLLAAPTIARAAWKPLTRKSELSLAIDRATAPFVFTEKEKDIIQSYWLLHKQGISQYGS